MALIVLTYSTFSPLLSPALTTLRLQFLFQFHPFYFRARIKLAGSCEKARRRWCQSLSRELNTISSLSFIRHTDDMYRLGGVSLCFRVCVNWTLQFNEEVHTWNYDIFVKIPALSLRSLRDSDEIDIEVINFERRDLRKVNYTNKFVHFELNSWKMILLLPVCSHNPNTLLETKLNVRGHKQTHFLSLQILFPKLISAILTSNSNHRIICSTKKYKIVCLMHSALSSGAIRGVLIGSALKTENREADVARCASTNMIGRRFDS